MKKGFIIPVEYAMYGYVEIEAETLEEALMIAHRDVDELPLPNDGEYIDGSYKINDEDISVVKVLNQ